MLAVAAVLGADFIRVDPYDVREKVFFGKAYPTRRQPDRPAGRVVEVDAVG